MAPEQIGHMLRWKVTEDIRVKRDCDGVFIGDGIYDLSLTVVETRELIEALKQAIGRFTG